MGQQHVIAACWVLYLLYWIISAKPAVNPHQLPSA